LWEFYFFNNVPFQQEMKKKKGKYFRNVSVLVKYNFLGFFRNYMACFGITKRVHYITNEHW